MNWAASPLASREMVLGAVQNGRAFVVSRVKQNIINKRKERIVSGQVIFFWGRKKQQGLYNTGDPTSADQEISD